MLNYSDRFEDITTKNTYFAGANTPRGFEGDYRNFIFEEEFERIYLIKGGAGTGKSTLMKRCAVEFENRGATVTYIRCSSDPDSLDGVIIERDKKSIAIIDATAPHVMDCRYPGACSEIIDCGRFWNSEVLEWERKGIIENTKNKIISYERAYRYLKAAGEIFDIQQRLADFICIWDKMEKAVSRICDALKGDGENGEVRYKRTQCISMKGAYRLTSFENDMLLYAVKDYSFLSPTFFDMLKKELLKRGFCIEVSVSPVFGICEIRVAKAGCSFVPYKEGKDFYRCINLSRFADADKAAEVKQKRIFTSNCLSAMIEGAVDSLKEAAKAHFALETIYKEAMDFSALGVATAKIIKNMTERI